MAHFSFFRFFGNALTGLRDDFCENKKWYIICFSVVILGLICGLVAGIKIAPDVSVDRIPDSFLRRFIEGDISVLGLFFARILVNLCFLAIIYATNVRPFMCCVSFILMAYRSFCFGLTCILLIAIFRVGGALNVLLIILPSQLLLLFAIVIWGVVCISYNFGCKIYGGSIFCSEFFSSYSRALSLALVLVAGSILWELMLLPWLSAFLIIS